MIATDDFMAARVVAKFRQEFPKLVTYWEEKSRDLSELERYNRKDLDYLAAVLSGPPPIIPIPHRPPQLAPEEVPRVVAKARAVAVFGPKRGRWK